jgi:phage-related holin
MSKAYGVASSIGGALLPVFSYFYGSDEVVKASMVALTFFIVMDWISGISAARKDRTYSSKYGIDGVFRSFFMLLLPAGGHLLDKAFSLPNIAFGVLATGLLYHTIKSMTANVVRTGWADWVPVTVLNWLLKWIGSELEQKLARAAERKVTDDAKS